MQKQSAVDQIRHRLSGIADNYNRLVLLVGPSGSGRTAVLRALADAEKAPVLNVGAEISRRLLDLTERQRVLQLPRLLEEAVVALPCDLTILDNTEVLFNPVLKQDPLRLLQGLSRNRTIVASWLGDVDGGHLTYAVPEHPEFRRYPSADLLVVCLRHNGEPAKVER
ncbi:MAG: BREX-3 system P-loop-containing protein BrxF [Candidatus Solibacter sp.]|nr:BREX-3 system P-loop-containing protein BrxF [Candidatus Solibacter sp.]